MFSLSVMLGSGQFRLLFKTEEAACTAYTILCNLTAPMNQGQQEVTDDFGQRLLVKAQNLHGLLYEDMDQSRLAAVELALAGARVQHMAMKQAQSDPALRMATAQSPILSPMGNGRLG